MSKKKIKFPGYILKDGKPEHEDKGINFPVCNDRVPPRDVAGFGSLIAPEVYDSIIDEYARLEKKLYCILVKVKNNEPLSDHEKEDLNLLIEYHDPCVNIVSGIYGRESLLHLLAQPECEGIRYVMCRFRSEKDKIDENSIALFSVDKTGKAVNRDKADRAEMYFEVKGGSKTIDGIQDGTITVADVERLKKAGVIRTDKENAGKDLSDFYADPLNEIYR